jgi:hypothetical protein
MVIWTASAYRVFVSYLMKLVCLLPSHVAAAGLPNLCVQMPTSARSCLHRCWYPSITESVSLMRSWVFLFFCNIVLCSSIRRFSNYALMPCCRCDAFPAMYWYALNSYHFCISSSSLSLCYSVGIPCRLLMYNANASSFS